MKLAWIDRRVGLEFGLGFASELRELGVELDCAENLFRFERVHSSLDNYDGLIMHPGVHMMRFYLKEIPEKYPGISWGLISWVKGDYLTEDIPVFSYSKPQEIVDYFEGRLGVED